jgi:hypothetical protein
VIESIAAARKLFVAARAGEHTITNTMAMSNREPARR